VSSTPNHLASQRDLLIAEIHVAFKNVKRGKGTSWAEAGVLDDYGTEKEQRAARAKDPEQPWPTLINHKMWKPWNDEWSDLDAEGFRFYLAPGMIREALDAIETDAATNFVYTLTLSSEVALFTPGMRELKLKTWSLLDDRQRRCVKRFLQFMIACERARHDASAAELGYEQYGPFRSEWLTALNSYWASIPDA